MVAVHAAHAVVGSPMVFQVRPGKKMWSSEFGILCIEYLLCGKGREVFEPVSSILIRGV